MGNAAILFVCTKPLPYPGVGGRYVDGRVTPALWEGKLLIPNSNEDIELDTGIHEPGPYTNLQSVSALVRICCGMHVAAYAGEVFISGSFLAEISDRSPQKLVMFII